MQYGSKSCGMFDSRSHRRAAHLLFLRGRHFHAVFHFGGRRMQSVLGLAAAVGALGLAVREPPPQWLQRTSVLLCAASAVWVTSDRAASAQVLRSRLLRLLGLARLLGLDLGQQGVQPGVLKRSWSGGPPRVCDQRVDGSALGSTAGRVTVWVTSVAAR